MPEIGQTLSRYRIVEKIGAGGMGEVYKARDQNLGRDVAVKVLPPDFAQDSERLARFEREAKALAKLAHPNILIIFDFGREAEVTYAVTELLEGETLRDRLAEGALPWRKAVEVAAAMADGFAISSNYNVGRSRWMPDGKAIAFVGLDDAGRTGVFVQDFVPGRDTTATRRKLAGFDPDYITESFAISPDGRQIVLSLLDLQSNIMVAEGVPGLTPARRKK